nr:hypothetical protein [Microbacterium lacticum]
MRLLERRVAPARAQHLGDEALHPLAGGLDQLEAVATALGQVLLEQQIGVADDRRQAGWRARA